MRILTGKFHSHITISANQQQKARDILQNNRIQHKMTTIELSKQDRSQSDSMITQHFHTRRFFNYDNIFNYIDHTKNVLIANGIDVSRVKIEHESLNYGADECNYIECHIKLRIPSGKRDYVLKKLSSDIPSFVASRNPNEVTTDFVKQFLNKRFYTGSLSAITEDIDKAKLFINKYCTIIETKVESAIYDTNLELDKWWA